MCLCLVRPVRNDYAFRPSSRACAGNNAVQCLFQRTGRLAMFLVVHFVHSDYSDICQYYGTEENQELLSINSLATPGGKDGGWSPFSGIVSMHESTATLGLFPFQPTADCSGLIPIAPDCGRFHARLKRGYVGPSVHVCQI